MKKIALHWKILIGMVIGVAFGFAMSNFEGGKEIVTNWVKPFGTIFINSLKFSVGSVNTILTPSFQIEISV